MTLRQTEPLSSTKTVTTLADGRELIYYDENGTTTKAEDRRTLEPVEARSEIRHDLLLDEWVVIATERQGRTHLPPSNECPLCPSSDGKLTEIPAADYDVVALQNRFPSLSPIEGNDGIGESGFIGRPGNGRCEVICYTSDHDAALADLSLRRLRTIVDVWGDRTLELSHLVGVEQVFVFENCGEEIGVTLHHPHGQVYAYPFVAPRTARKLESAERQAEKTGRCLFCEVVAAELDTGKRIVFDSEHWVAFVPSSARWPFELHVYPRRHVPDLPSLTGEERDDLARTLKDVLGRFTKLFPGPVPYMATWQQAPVRTLREIAHLHLELFTPRRAENRLKYLAGSESGAGVFINDVRPEEAARRLRAD